MAPPRFPAATHLSDAGLCVIRLLRDAPRAKEIIYRVRYDCCGAMDELSHNAIRRREAKGRRAIAGGLPVPVCSACRYRAHQLAALRLAMDADDAATVQWPPPPSALRNPQFWVPR